VDQAEWRPARVGLYPDTPPSPRARKLDGKAAPAKNVPANIGSISKLHIVLLAQTV
jgi:hypothetical protein